ncbi:MAG: [Fe-Fe] hydrogenase large subunit C-terminal domain-containing protein [Lentimicrobiaceae bacterium]
MDIEKVNSEKFEKVLCHGQQMISPVYTEKNNCQDCYKCLRQCPVKAIKIESGSASVIASECIYCGHCVQVCPVGAKKVRDDFSKLSEALDQGMKVIACLAPSYISEFPGLDPQVLAGALKKLGFWGVSETALGAEIVAEQTSAYIKEKSEGIFISSCCPSVVRLINKHYPQLADYIVPVLSPMQTHSKVLKGLYGPDVQTAFFGPCIAKKGECDDYPGLTDYALTFSDLHDFLDMNYPSWELQESEQDNIFIPTQAGKGSYFPVDGGMIANMKRQTSMTDASFMSFSGITSVKEVLNNLAEWKTGEPLFLELLICEGGCVKGPCSINSSSVAIKRQRVLKEVNLRKETLLYTGAQVDITFDQKDDNPVNLKQVTEAEIANALKSTGKFTEADELNCGGCGYDSCRDFAIAMLNGKAERLMCVSNNRRVAQDKASVLLKKIPYGVVMVDETLTIIDSNRLFAEILGGEVLELYNSLGKLEGSDLKKVAFFHKLFSSVLYSGEEMIERRIRENGLLLNVSVITLQPHKIVCGIIRNLQDPEVRKDHVLNTTRQVIHQNMEIVQKIAFLLGENAAYTESMLNSIVESVDQDHHSIQE